MCYLIFSPNCRQNLQPGLLRKKWTQQEDEKIIKGHLDGLSWPDIAALLPGRLPEHIRSRFLNEIDPTLQKTPFTETERHALLELQARYGNKWTKIASEMPGRSEAMVKNFWFNSKISSSRKARMKATNA